MTITDTAGTAPAEPVPVAWFGRTSTLVLQDPAASLRRQLRAVQDRLPAGWFIAAHFWDVESGGLDLDERGHGSYDHLNIGLPRDGGMAALIAEAGAPAPRFAAVMCEDISRSSRDTYSAIRLEKKLDAAGVPLLAADEPIDIAATGKNTILMRRMKQAMAEYFRFELKDKAWGGFKDHALQGYNIGRVPYGYAAHRTPHPNPAKAAEGRSKTRLVLDPGRAPVVAQIYAWRTADKLGVNTIAARLNADPAQYPPPAESGCWQVSAVARILANPKYTGHMVYGRTRTSKGKRGRKAPPDQWLWSPQPAHPPIITRATWDAAQAAGQEHGSSRDAAGPSSHPATRYDYPLRGIIRCRECRRRMSGRRKTGRPGAPPITYYACPRDPKNPRHAAASPDHPATVQVREDLIQAILADFINTRIFGPDRAKLVTAALPGTAQASRRRQQETADLTRKLHQIDTAEDAHAREITELTRTDADPRAITAIRTRLIQRFTELEKQRDDITTRLSQLAAAAPATDDPALLDNIPRLAGILNNAPARLWQDLCRAFQIQILYNPDADQISCYATITPATPHALAAIINDSEPPQRPTPTSSARAAATSPDMLPHSLHVTPTTVTVQCGRSGRGLNDSKRSHAVVGRAQGHDAVENSPEQQHRDGVANPRTPETELRADRASPSPPGTRAGAAAT